MVSRDELIHATLARIETKLDQVVDNDKDKEKRIRSLERWKWSHVMSGAGLALIAAKLGIPLPGAH